MVRADGRLRQLGDDDVADAAVARLDDLVAVAKAGADEPVRAALPIASTIPRWHARRLGHDRDGERSSADGDRPRAAVARLPGAGRVRLPTSAASFTASPRRAGWYRASSSMRNGLPPDSRATVSAADSSRDPGGQAPAGEILEARAARRGRLAPPPRRASERDLDQERAALRLLVAVSGDEQDRRWIRRAHQLDQERRAVGVAPVRVVDVDDEWLTFRERSQDLSERREGAPARATGLVETGRCEIATGGHPQQHREEAGERGGVGREREEARAAVERHQVTAQRVDDAVHGLVRDGLAFVRAATKDHRRAADLVEEASHQGRCAHAGRARYAHRDRRPLLHGLEGVSQRVQRRLAPDESASGVRTMDRSRGPPDRVLLVSARATGISAPPGRSAGSRRRRSFRNASSSDGAPPARSSSRITPTLYQSLAAVGASPLEAPEPCNARSRPPPRARSPRRRSLARARSRRPDPGAPPAPLG